MSRIVRLPEDLSNQIAAGEVVERPASVIKELLENAIDAGASRIQVDVEAGGVGLLRVTDDGCGMDETDARACVERHATSKIHRFDDLLALETFGFRGEALPSIASVSRFALRTRERDASAGVEVIVDGGAPPDVRPCGLAPGTSVEVRDLFFNVPARRKFLKALSTEASAITQVVDSLAFAAPTLTFVLMRDGRKARQWLRSPSRKDRGLEAHPNEKLAFVGGKRGPLQLEAYLSPPEHARTGATGLVILVNNRVVRDRLLAKIVAHAYGSVLEQGRYPVGVLYLDIDSNLVDVNVHPQKAEVRFADSKAVHDAVYRLISDGLAGAFGLAPPMRAGSAFHRDPSGMPPALEPVRRPAEVVALAARESRQDTDGPASVPPPSVPDAASEPDPWQLRPPVSAPPSMQQVSLALSPSPSPSEDAAAQPATRDRPAGYASLRFLAQLRGTFLLCESSEGLVILDQHAAAERVTFARYRAAYQSRSVASQRLLTPLTFAIDPDYAALIEESADEIAATGLELRVVGPSTASVFAVPQIVSRASPERLARDLLDEVARTGERSFSGAVDLALATMACHGSLRAGEKVAPEEAQELLASLDHVDYAGHCPHGRPTIMRISYAELERQVGRR